jgi:hypothetical protein
VLHCACRGLGGNAEEWSDSRNSRGSQGRYRLARYSDLAAGSDPEACVRSPLSERAFPVMYLRHFPTAVKVQHIAFRVLPQSVPELPPVGEAQGLPAGAARSLSRDIFMSQLSAAQPVPQAPLPAAAEPRLSSRPAATTSTFSPRSLRPGPSARPAAVPPPGSPRSLRPARLGPSPRRSGGGVPQAPLPAAAAPRLARVRWRRRRR